MPKSSKNEICGIYSDSLKIKISAPPEDGKANKELINFLSDFLDISRNTITLVSGQASKKKTIQIDNTNANDILKKIKFKP